MSAWIAVAKSSPQKSRQVILISLEFLVPLIILVFCYGKIAWIVTRRINSNLSSLNSNKFQLVRTNTFKTMFIVTLTFVICLSNNRIYYLMYMLGYDVDWYGLFAHFALVMVFINCTINPFIYLLKYQDFQKALKKSLGYLRLKETEDSDTRLNSISPPVTSL